MKIFSVYFIVFFISMLIFSLTQLDSNPTGAGAWILICIVVIGWFGYGLYKTSLTGSYQVKDSTKDIAAYRKERMLLRQKHGVRNGYMGCPTSKTGLFSDAYKIDYKDLCNKYGIPGSDTFTSVKAREKAYSSGIRDKQYLEYIGNKAVEDRNESLNANL